MSSRQAEHATGWDFQRLLGSIAAQLEAILDNFSESKTLLGIKKEQVEQYKKFINKVENLNAKHSLNQPLPTDLMTTIEYIRRTLCKERIDYDI